MDITAIYNSACAFYSLAEGYSDFREGIEEAARKNKKPFGAWFTAGDRVYIPLTSADQPDSDDNKIINYLKGNGYAVDYVGGYAVKNGRKEKIGKLLAKQQRLELIEAEKHRTPDRKKEAVNRFFEDLKFIFENSDIRSASTAGDLTVVISQNPHDIGAMSTERSWTSCMNLEGGQRSNDVYCEVSSGGLIAYLIKSGDTNIEKPLARTLIRRYANKKGKSYAIVEGQVYGNAPPGFVETVKKWVNDRQGATKGLYTMRGSPWTDSLPTEMLPNPENMLNEAMFFHKSHRKYPSVILRDVVINKSKYPEKIINEAEGQLFEGLHLNNDVIHSDFFIQAFSDYIKKHPHTINSFVLRNSMYGLTKALDGIRKIDAETAQKLEDAMTNAVNNEINNNETTHKFDKYELQSKFVQKMEIASPDKKYDAVKETLKMGEKLLDAHRFALLVNQAAHCLFMKGDIELRDVFLMKPYIEKKICENWDSYRDFAYFLAACQGRARWILPKLKRIRKMLADADKVNTGYIDKIIEAIEEDKYVSLTSY